MPEETTTQPAVPTAETTTPAATSEPAQPPQEPIVEAKKPASNSMWLIAGALVILVIAVAAYAYSQGYFSGIYPTATSENTAATPTVSDEIASLQVTSDEVNQNLSDLNSAVAGLDAVDFSGDEVPSL